MKAVDLEKLKEENETLLLQVQRGIETVGKNIAVMHEEIERRAKWLNGPRKGRQPYWYVDKKKDKV